MPARALSKSSVGKPLRKQLTSVAAPTKRKAQPNKPLMIPGTRKLRAVWGDSDNYDDILQDWNDEYLSQIRLTKKFDPAQAHTVVRMLNEMREARKAGRWQEFDQCEKRVNETRRAFCNARRA